MIVARIRNFRKQSSRANNKTPLFTLTDAFLRALCAYRAENLIATPLSLKYHRFPREISRFRSPLCLAKRYSPGSLQVRSTFAPGFYDNVYAAELIPGTGVGAWPMPGDRSKMARVLALAGWSVARHMGNSALPCDLGRSLADA